MPVLIMGVDISSAGGSDMCQGSVVFCLRDVMLRSYFIPNPTEITSFSYSNFLSSCALGSPALKQGPFLSCSLDGKHQTKGVGYSCPMPPLRVEQHPSSVWSLDGSAWQQMMTLESGLCIAQV